jgi:hypothetical protein
MSPHDKKRALIDEIAREAKAHNIKKVGAFGMGFDPVTLIVQKVNAIPADEIQGTLEMAHGVVLNIGERLKALIDA